MLKAHPATLRELLARYTALRTAYEAEPSPHLTRRLEDVTYTLCVSTGTRDLAAALRAARSQLTEGPAEGAPAPAG